MKAIFKARKSLNPIHTLKIWFDPSMEGNPYKKESRFLEPNTSFFSFRIKFGKRFAV